MEMSADYFSAPAERAHPKVVERQETHSQILRQTSDQGLISDDRLQHHLHPPNSSQSGTTHIANMPESQGHRLYVKYVSAQPAKRTSTSITKGNALSPEH